MYLLDVGTRSDYGGEKMDAIISDCISKLEFGEPQRFNNMGVIPLLTPITHSPKYMTLKEALEKKLLTVTEVDLGGSVPELKVANKAEIPVLLLDGEELVGAKQNRVLRYVTLKGVKKMLEQSLKKIIPDTYSTFPKLERGDPYHFDRWDSDINGDLCLYYWFWNKNQTKKNKKRVVISEMEELIRNSLKKRPHH